MPPFGHSLHRLLDRLLLRLGAGDIDWMIFGIVAGSLPASRAPLLEAVHQHLDLLVGRADGDDAVA